MCGSHYSRPKKSTESQFFKNRNHATSQNIGNQILKRLPRRNNFFYFFIFSERGRFRSDSQPCYEYVPGIIYRKYKDHLGIHIHFRTPNKKTSNKKGRPSFTGKQEILEPLYWSYCKTHPFSNKKSILGQPSCFLLAYHHANLSRNIMNALIQY